MAISNFLSANSLSGFERKSNKAIDFSTSNHTLYPTVQAVVEYLGVGIEASKVAYYIQTTDVSTDVNTFTQLPSPGIGTNTIPPDSTAVGDTYKLELGGIITSDNTTEVTIDIRVGGATVSSVVLPLISGEQIVSIDYLFTIRTLGLTGSLKGYGKAVLNSGLYPFSMGAPTTISTTGSNAIAVATTFGSGVNNITISNYLITKYNL